MPFRPFYLLAALDGFLGVAIWIPVILGWPPWLSGDAPAGAWHARELLFAMVPAMIAGFLRTAMPRWTRREPAFPTVWGCLVPLWLVGRVAALWSPFAASLASALFLLILSVLVVHHVTAHSDDRNRKVAALTSLLAMAALATLWNDGGGFLSEMSGRAALAATLGLIMVLGGRVAPSLTASHLGLPDKTCLFAERRRFENAAGIVAAVALAAWVVAPGSAVTGCASALAASTQAVRLSQWRGWRVAGTPAIAVIHIAYACVPLGFALLAGHVLHPNGLALGAAVHAWTVGGIGLMCVALMSSMIRKHARRAFSFSPAMTLCHGLGIAACVLRVCAEIAVTQRMSLLLAAAVAWTGGFALFLIAFGPVLATGRAAARSPSRPSEP